MLTMKAPSPSPALVISAWVLSALLPTNLVPFKVESPKDYARAISGYYTKHEFKIPMRDGVELHTAAWIPKDETKKWPILIVRTPYGLTGYGMENAPDFSTRHATKFSPAKAMVQAGYIFVQQDVRGKMMSQGSFVDVRPRERQTKAQTPTTRSLG